MSAQSPDLIYKIAEWRQKAREGTLSLEETKLAIQALRKDRGAVTQATAGSKVKKPSTKKAPIDSDDLLSGLEDI